MTASLDLDQLRRHIVSISRKSPGERNWSNETVLLGLATEDIPVSDAALIAEFAAANGVIFKAITFATLVSAIQDVCAEYETGLQAIVTDYVDYLNSENLLYAGENWMLVVPCGTSLAENTKFHVYYDGAQRPRRSKCRYLGLYHEKRVSLVGAIKQVFIASYQDGQVVVEQEERGKVDDLALTRVKGIIEATPYYDLDQRPHRYFVVDRFEPTNLVKTSKGSVRGAQYLKLSQIFDGVEGALPTAELAERLRDQVFPDNDSAI